MTTAVNIIPPAQLAIAAAVLYSAPAQTKTVIKKLTFTNTGNVAALVTVYLVPSGGAAGAPTTLRKTRSVAALDVYECVEAQNHVLEPGASIQAFSSLAATITVVGSGVEIA